MPATCFSGPPRSAAVIAQRCRLSLQPLSEAWFATARVPAFSQRLVCTGGLKCSAGARARLLAPAFVAPRRLARASASKTLASWAGCFAALHPPYAALDQF